MLGKLSQSASGTSGQRGLVLVLPSLPLLPPCLATNCAGT